MCASRPVSDCAEGATVVLTALKTKQRQETTTNNYGDFKFDGLDDNSGKYELEVKFNGTKQTRGIELQKSINIGVIIL